MKVVNIHANVYRLPPSVPWEDATNKVDGLEFIVVEVTADNGMTGTGISYTVDIGGTVIKTLIEDYLANLIIGMNPLDYERIWQHVQRQSRRLGLGVNSMAIAAIDTAIWDLIGKIHNQPLYKLLGGARDRIPAYISEIDLRSDGTIDQLTDRVKGYIGQGYRTVKIKIGKPELEEDIERIAKVQELLGPGGTVLVDLNQKWSAAEAIQKGTRLDKLNLGWIEEPMLYQDIQGHRQLKQAIRTPIALGESMYSKQQFLEYLKADAVDIVQADVAFVGGITEWLKIAHLADAFGKPVAPHFMMELSLHLLCGVPNSYMLENVVGGSLTELGLLEIPIEVRGGMGVPSELPGHGIVFDRDALQKHLLDPAALRNTFAGGSK
ncbi:mandelate racemase/muconate lactonizing enzyme family protein [Paenibacillus sp. N4]|uniref:mandelate racemase/muconate lactonizing enzyme family protein n=1 Tax=Paenibacillus vietnamensis TaxID=2590547 RepID=UPI001CD13718|nr:mandelate racemase/muconate lactonizing enzyme family protein [Paenibacillus vietnamensis]MCA0757631.1 mandelate racemase/muconate lactonizing enzyme family protein [Paenibacillus vietnamensis]